MIETEYETLYPKLKYFFSAYFHSDWKDVYNWQEKKPSFQVVVHDFKANNSKPTINQTIQELERFLRDDLTETELREIVVHKLGANLYAPGIGLTYRQWLQAIEAILKESFT